MADISPDDIPFVMSKNVGISDKDGKPTTAMLDWFQSLWSWMKRSVVDLTTKVDTLTDTVGDNTAAITAESVARASADSAIAATVTTVDAKVGNISAGGAVYLAAHATPAGATAAYGWYLTAGSAFAGMEAVALSGGGSAINFTAGQFRFTDNSGLNPIYALSYTGGVWELNGAIVIRSGTSGARTVITSSVIEVYDASNVLRVRMGIW
jgi:hypothetical protein